MPTTFCVRINGGKEMAIKTKSFRWRAAVCAAFAHISDEVLDRGKVKVEVMCPQIAHKGWYRYLVRFDDASRLIIEMATQK